MTCFLWYFTPIWSTSLSCDIFKHDSIKWIVFLQFIFANRDTGVYFLHTQKKQKSIRCAVVQFIIKLIVKTTVFILIFGEPIILICFYHKTYIFFPQGSFVIVKSSIQKYKKWNQFAIKPLVKKQILAQHSLPRCSLLHEHRRGYCTKTWFSVSCAFIIALFLWLKTNPSCSHFPSDPSEVQIMEFSYNILK